MFGDFSSFSHDPEEGVSGVYLSQGSPLLDSDWNEQVAALTEWLTVLGRTISPDRASFYGFGLAKGTGKSLEVAPGMGLVHGRPVQSQSWQTGDIARPGADGAFQISGKRIWSDDLEHATAYQVSLSVVTRIVPSEMVTGVRPPELSSQGTRELTDWMIHVGSVNKEDRSFGDGNGLTPRMEVALQQSCSDGVWLIECHTAGIYKISSTPDNVVMMRGEVTAENTLSIPRSRFFDNLAPGSPIYVEYHDDQTVHDNSMSLLLTDVPKHTDVFEATVTLSAKSAILHLSGLAFPSTGDPEENRDATKAAKSLLKKMTKRRPVLRLWHYLSPAQDQKSLFALKPDEKQPLLFGDRWYFPVVNGKAAAVMLPGHRVFRAITKLGSITLTQEGSIESTSDRSKTPIQRTDEQNNAPKTADSPAADRPPMDEPQAAVRPFSDSMHRLTSALNATRVLTRNTPCKELQTRVSCLPLRRWLASAYVHELADLDLDAFVSKVQRSIDIVPEDEYRFREQAALVLEEARALAGCVEPAPVQWA